MEQALGIPMIAKLFKHIYINNQVYILSLYMNTVANG